MILPVSRPRPAGQTCPDRPASSCDRRELHEPRRSASGVGRTCPAYRPMVALGGPLAAVNRIEAVSPPDVPCGPADQG